MIFHLLSRVINNVRRTLTMIISKLIFISKFRLLKCDINEGCKIDGAVLVKIAKPKSIKIGKNFTLNSRAASNLVGINNKASFQCIENGEIIIGNNCGFTSTVLSSRTKIEVGDRVMIGGNVRIFDHDYHSLNYEHRKNSKTDSANCLTRPVLIGNDVFIGTNSIILKGVKIGDRSVIGAGSVVSLREIPPDSLVAGNPARIIKRLSFND